MIGLNVLSASPNWGAPWGSTNGWKNDFRRGAGSIGGAVRLRERRRAGKGGAALGRGLHAASGGHAAEDGEAPGAAPGHDRLCASEEGQRLYLRRRRRMRLRLRRRRGGLSTVSADTRGQQHRADAGDDGALERGSRD